MDEDLVTEFLNESREHLATIETDLLAIEKDGADADEALINKVFRAAHSIKGGSGFFGLVNVKELAHRVETVLDMLRSKKIIPNAEVTNILLAAFDKLREMINNPVARENTDIADLVTNLTGLASSFLLTENKGMLSQETQFSAKGTELPINLPQVDLERVQRSGQHLYCIYYDLIHDIENRGQNVLQVFRDLEEFGEIVDCALDFEAVGNLDTSISDQLPSRIIFASGADLENIAEIFGINRERISLLSIKKPKLSKKPRKDSNAPPRIEPSPKKEEDPDILAASKPDAPVPISDKTTRPDASAIPEPRLSNASGDETLRVNVGLLETLMNLAGELVLSRNQLRTAVAQKNIEALSIADQRLNQVTSELQDAIMRTRLQPIGNVFGKFPRVVRDMAMALNKEIQVDVLGKDVALDRSLIEGLSDPLTHMVRNSVDHGIEDPEKRVRAGKKRTGTIRVEAKHEAGQVVIEIADDGKGIDPQKIGAAALSKGLVSADQLRGMADQDKVGLIFLPGLSTAEKVSDLSGRGVGMDVVKTNLDRLGGKIEIKSDIGKGTLFRIKLPLTLTIIPSLIMSIGKERFAIPQINIEELLHLRAEDVKRRIEVVGGAEVLLLRDKIIPLIKYDRFLGMVPSYVDPTTGTSEIDRRINLADRRSPHYPFVADDSNTSQPASTETTERRCSDGRRIHDASALEIAVVTTGTLQYGLVVGSFHNTEEIVVKPLGRHLKSLREYAGATILGDGTVALILDIAGLAAKAKLAAVADSTRAIELARQAEREKREDTHSLLLFHNAPDELCATPLDIVLRIERITQSTIENTGGRRTMQYRGASLPLLSLSDAANVKPIGESKDFAVIVFNVRGREVGLLGAMPVDVVEIKTSIDQLTHRQRGIVGSTIIQNRTALITDIFELVDAAYPEWSLLQEQAETIAGNKNTGGNTVLLAEDSGFFRAQIKRYMEDAGYKVMEAPDGEAAWDLLLQNIEAVQAIVTDIEMPRLTGLELVQRIRADERTAKLPVIALTSLASEEDITKGKAAGIDDYQIKLDRDKLIESLRQSMARS
jgi:two-component system, chemotaxis family, sensor kinase CheA